MGVAVKEGTSWAATSPSMIVKGGYITVPGGNPGVTYAVSPDGERFLLVKPGTGSAQPPAPPNIVVVQHWADELTAKVPTP
jgi:hypothetical protein